MEYLFDDISLNMFKPSNVNATLTRNIKKEEIPSNIISAIKNKDLENIVLGMLKGIIVSENHPDVKLTGEYYDIGYIARYIGPKLPNGATKLTKGARIDFLKVAIIAGCTNCENRDCSNCSKTSAMHGKF